MKRAELITAFREFVDDEALPPLWKDSEVRRYLDDAHREAAERAFLLRDSTTAAITQVPVLVDTAGYSLDKRIIRVDRAKLRLQNRPLKLTSTAKMDADHPGWQSVKGDPSYLVLDAEAGTWKGTLSPIPTKADTLDLVVYRTPLGPMDTDDDAPEIAERYHLRLLDWMAHLAYKKRDAETFNEAKSQEHEAAFAASFGPRVEADVQRKRAEHRTHTVQFVEF